MLREDYACINTKGVSGTLFPWILATDIESGLGHLTRIRATNTRPVTAGRPHHIALMATLAKTPLCEVRIYYKRTCFYFLCLMPIPWTKFLGFNYYPFFYLIPLPFQSMAPQARASHILVKTEDEASKIMRRVADGEVFAAIAKRFSSCPSGKNGGDLG